MEPYQKLVTSAFMLVGTLGLLRCNEETQSPVYVIGKVKNEGIERNIANPDRYVFSVETPEGIKTFTSFDDATTLDVLINNGDEIVFEFPPNWNTQKSNVSFLKKEILSINGKRLVK